MAKNSNVGALILTESFPFPGGDDFLAEEIGAWRVHFGRISIAPAHRTGPSLPLPSGVTVNDMLARADTPIWRILWAVRALASRPLWIELGELRRPSIAAVMAIWKAQGRFHRARRALTKLLRVQGADVIYCYWMNPEALAAASLRLRGKTSKVIARTHGIDLYEGRWPAGHMPLRDRYIRGFDAILPVSDAGAQHLAARYPWLVGRLVVSRLGVNLPATITPPTARGELHLVSTSSCVPVKRLERIPQALRLLQDTLPMLDVRWTHIGDGPLWRDLVDRSHQLLGDRATFLGRLAPRQVVEYYGSNKIDAIINTSESEGVPVALMEAMACGIPAIAPDVGGISELISTGSGWLLRPDVDAAQIASTVQYALPQMKTAAVRLAARQQVQTSFSSSHNYSQVSALAWRLATEEFR